MTTATVKSHHAHDADAELTTVALDLSGRPAKPTHYCSATPKPKITTR
jgi:hypothetical protein